MTNIDRQWWQTRGIESAHVIGHVWNKGPSKSLLIEKETNHCWCVLSMFIHSGFPTMGVPPVIIHFNGMFSYKPPIWGYPHFRKAPFKPMLIRVRCSAGCGADCPEARGSVRFFLPLQVAWNWKFSKQFTTPVGWWSGTTLPSRLGIITLQ